ncbi:MAG: hypothetical protein ACOYKM_10720 [Caulobacterales bacterium]|jgi:hypothetical protein
MTFDAIHAPEFQILVELMAAARTETMLRPILALVTVAFDQQRIRLT